MKLPNIDSFSKSDLSGFSKGFGAVLFTVMLPVIMGTLIWLPVDWITNDETIAWIVTLTIMGGLIAWLFLREVYDRHLMDVMDEHDGGEVSDPDWYEKLCEEFPEATQPAERPGEDWRV